MLESTGRYVSAVLRWRGCYRQNMGSLKSLQVGSTRAWMIYQISLKFSEWMITHFPETHAYAMNESVSWLHPPRIMNICAKLYRVNGCLAILLMDKRKMFNRNQRCFDKRINSIQFLPAFSHPCIGKKKEKGDNLANQFIKAIKTSPEKELLHHTSSRKRPFVWYSPTSPPSQADTAKEISSSCDCLLFFLIWRVKE